MKKEEIDAVTHKLKQENGFVFIPVYVLKNHLKDWELYKYLNSKYYFRQNKEDDFAVVDFMTACKVISKFDDERELLDAMRRLSADKLVEYEVDGRASQVIFKINYDVMLNNK